MKEGESVLEKVSANFAEQTQDLQEVTKHCNDPLYMAALIHKLIEERQKTNRLLEQINEKYDRIMLELKQGSPKVATEDHAHTTHANEFQMMAEQDSAILKYIEQHGQASAKDIKTIMNYKGLNAASQRLNKLFKEDYLKKVQVGKKVLYLVKS